MLIGSWLSGIIVGQYTLSGPDNVQGHNWQYIWLVPAIASVIVFVFFALLFREKEVPKQMEVHS
jgi:MFS family permease